MRVRDWMSPDPVTVTPLTSVREARQMLHYYGVRHLPVVERDRVVGMVSDRDVHANEGDVRVVMSSPVHVIAPDEPIEAVARSMLSWRISALPVVDGDGVLLGVITTTDCLLASLSPRRTVAQP